jgi:hypothetical protein
MLCTCVSFYRATLTRGRGRAQSMARKNSLTIWRLTGFVGVLVTSALYGGAQGETPITGAQREVAQSNRSRPGRACYRDLKRGLSRTGRAAAHELGPTAQTGLRHRYGTRPNCGGALKIIAAIEDPPVIVKILSHLDLPTRAPPRSPARRVDLFQTI